MLPLSKPCSPPVTYQMGILLSQLSILFSQRSKLLYLLLEGPNPVQLCLNRLCIGDTPTFHVIIFFFISGNAAAISGWSFSSRSNSAISLMVAGLGLQDKLPVGYGPAAEGEAGRALGVRPGVYSEPPGRVRVVCGVLFVRNGLDYRQVS